MYNLSAQPSLSDLSQDLSKESCFFLPEPKFDKVSDRYLVNSVTSVLNSILSPCAVVGNSFILWVILKHAFCRSPIMLLLGCLAASDLLVGLFVQPSYVSFRVWENHDKFVPCALRLFYSTVFFICYGVSLVTLCAISCERYIALIYPFRYNHFVRQSRVIKLVTLIWALNILLTGLQWVHNTTARAIHLALWQILLLVAVGGQLRLLPVIRRHQKRMKQLQHFSNFYKNAASLMQVKFAANLACIVAVYLAFNLPVLLITALHQIVQIDIDTYNLYSWAETLAFLNSTLNPVNCIWRVREIRSAISVLWPRRSERKRQDSSLKYAADNTVVLTAFRQK